jgi:hypothetical protein
MKKVGFLVFASALFLGLNSCSKDCHECHYEDANNAEVELGEKLRSSLPRTLIFNRGSIN